MNYFASKSAPAWSIPRPQQGNETTKLRKLEIPLPSLPRRYQSGDGPRPPAPLSIILKNDSTAQIFEKRVLPGPMKNGELSLQMHYVVGWSDLPAARVAIQAQHILDYVSPRVLEDFEYKLYLEREAREEEEDVAAAIAAVAAAEAAENAALGLKPAPKPPSNKWKRPRRRKKKNRPSKADLIAKKQAEETSFNHSEAAAMSATLSTATQNTTGPSLTAPPQSTPKKKKSIAPNAIIANSEDDALIYDVEEEDEMDIDDELAIMRQLRQATTRASEGFGSSDSEVGDATLRPRSADRSVSIKKEQTPPVLMPLHTLDTTQPLVSDYSTTSKQDTTPAQVISIKSTLQHYGFTPVAKSTAPWPAVANAHAHPSPQTHSIPNLLTEETSAPSEAKPPRSKGKKKKKKIIVIEDEEEEQVWEVKALEGMQVEVVGGKTIRWFKVRWKGNWPADQNPTWEPEDNIDRLLIKKYLAKVAATGGQGPSAVVPLVKPQLKRKYSSVAEAVMGDAEDEGDRRSPAPPGASKLLSSRSIVNDAQNHVDRRGNMPFHSSGSDDGSENDDDILQVTEPEMQHVETPYRSQDFNDALLRELETSFRRQDAWRSSERSSSS